MSTVLVTGGTGRLGRALVDPLVVAGHRVRVLSRRPAAPHPGVEPVVGDLVAGTGLDAAVAGVDVVVHCASIAGRRDVPMTANLVDAARRAANPHVIDVSIVGVDRIPLPYYRTKLACEGLLAGSGLPWTVLRATQFHDLVTWLFDLQRRWPVLVVPAGVRLQPVDVRDVAARLVELVAAPAAGRVPDIGGPEVVALSELAQQYVQARGLRRRVLAVPVPGAIARAFREAHNLAPERAVGRTTFADFLRLNHLPSRR